MHDLNDFARHLADMETGKALFGPEFTLGTESINSDSTAYHEVINYLHERASEIYARMYGTVLPGWEYKPSNLGEVRDPVAFWEQAFGVMHISEVIEKIFPRDFASAPAKLQDVFETRYTNDIEYRSHRPADMYSEFIIYGVSQDPHFLDTVNELLDEYSKPTYFAASPEVNEVAETREMRAELMRRIFERLIDPEKSWLRDALQIETEEYGLVKLERYKDINAHYRDKIPTEDLPPISYSIGINLPSATLLGFNYWVQLDGVCKGLSLKNLIDDIADVKNPSALPTADQLLVSVFSAIIEKGAVSSDDAPPNDRYCDPVSGKALLLEGTDED